MTNYEFHQLKVGDEVFNSKLTRKVQITEIHKKRGLIRTEGEWRGYKKVCLAKELVECKGFTPITPPTHMLFSVQMLQDFSLLQAAIIHTIRAAGPRGFVGTRYTLCAATPLCKDPDSLNMSMRTLYRKRILFRERISETVYRFYLNEEQIKQYL